MFTYIMYIYVYYIFTLVTKFGYVSLVQGNNSLPLYKSCGSLRHSMQIGKTMIETSFHESLTFWLLEMISTQLR